MIRHARIEIADSALCPRLFADYYAARYDPPVRPLACFWGGAISAQEYERRRATTPDLIVQHWRTAVAGLPRRPDLLVFPLPDVEPCTTLLLRRRLRRAFAEVVAASPNPWCSEFAYLGHSAGALLATYLAFDVPGARALATLGGLGMAGALADTARPALVRLSIAAFANNGDPCRDQTRDFIQVAAAHGKRVGLTAGAGRHELADYAANGTLGAALSFVTRHLMARQLLQAEVH